MVIYHATEEEYQRNSTTIKNLYYKPESAARVHEGLNSGPHYKAVLIFLTTLDFEMAHIANALMPLKPLYENVFGKRDAPLRGDEDFVYDTWDDLIKLASSGHESAQELRDKLLSWSKRHHLYTKHNLYLEIALRAILHYHPVWGRVLLALGLAGAEDDKIVNDYVNKHPFVFAPSWEELSVPIDGGHGFARTFQLEWDNEPERYEHMPSDGIGSWKGFSWDPREENATDFTRKMQGAFDKYKKSYIQRMEQFMKQQGYVEIPKGMRKEKLDLHMKWFIERHFCGKQYKEIAEEYSIDNEKGTTERNISNAVKEISDLVLLPLDPHGN